MINIKTKYLILIWIIILILFTFYCIFRLYYLKEKYDTVSLLNLPSSQLSGSQQSSSLSQNTSPNIITYINNIETTNNNTHIRLPSAAFTNTTNQTCIIFIIYQSILNIPIHPSIILTILLFYIQMYRL